MTARRGQGAVEENLDRLYRMAKDSVNKTWMNPRQLLGPVLYRALLGEELLRLAAVNERAGFQASGNLVGAGLWDRLRADPEVNGDG
jgi:hypothetical protein